MFCKQDWSRLRSAPMADKLHEPHMRHPCGRLLQRSVRAKLPPDLRNGSRHAQMQVLQLPRILAAGLAAPRICPCGEGHEARVCPGWPQQGPGAKRRGGRRC